jgi:hypothetical protein
VLLEQIAPLPEDADDARIARGVVCFRLAEMANLYTRERS